jgi:hypothetical protein
MRGAKGNMQLLEVKIAHLDFIEVTRGSWAIVCKNRSRRLPEQHVGRFGLDLCPSLHVARMRSSLQCMDGAKFEGHIKDR